MESGPHAHTASEVTAVSHDAIERDQDLWFEDGNIVAVAQRTAFRFHRGALSRHSQVFRDLFAVPQPAPSESTETFDGCPVIHVSDTRSDFKHLLIAVYDGMSFSLGDKTKELSALVSWARMGHKYGLDSLLEGSLRQLKTVFTTDFSTWESNVSTPEIAAAMRSQNAIEAVNLFRLTGRTDMLVTALFLCCWHNTTKELLQGVPRADGTPENLEIEDLRRCLDARIGLVKYDAQIVTQFFLDELKPKTSCDICNLSMIDGAREAACEFLELLDGDPLSARYFNRRIDDLMELEAVCLTCAEELKTRHAALRATVWAALPYIFDLEVPDWPQWDAV